MQWIWSPLRFAGNPGTRGGGEGTLEFVVPFARLCLLLLSGFGCLSCDVAICQEAKTFLMRVDVGG